MGDNATHKVIAIIELINVIGGNQGTTPGPLGKTNAVVIRRYVVTADSVGQTIV